MNIKMDFTNVRKHLPHGAQKEISKKAGVSFNTINRVLNNKSKNTKVLIALADYLDDLNETETSAIKRITDLIS